MLLSTVILRMSLTKERHERDFYQISSILIRFVYIAFDKQQSKRYHIAPKVRIVKIWARSEITLYVKNDETE